MVEVEDGQIVGSQYLADCTEYGFPSVDSVRNYCQIIRKEARKALLNFSLKQAANDLNEKEPEDILAEIIGRNTAIAGSSRLRTGAQVLKDIKDKLKKPVERYSTGMSKLDKAMGGGLYAGFTYGFAGQEKMGKTTMAHTISKNLADQGITHMYAALEMGSEQIEQRNLSRDMKINSLKFLDQDLFLKTSLDNVKANENIIYLDHPGATLNDILGQVNIASVRHGIKGVIIDYWQLIEGQGSRESEERHLRRVAQRIADYGRKHGLWIILLAQLNDEGKLFGGKGLKKACDQLFYIMEASDQHPLGRWLKMDASRYTPKADLGTAEEPSVFMDMRHGPYFFC